MEKCGKPTFLKLYGLNEVNRLQGIYRVIVNGLARELEQRGVQYAIQFAQAQYNETLMADTRRNLPDGIMPSSTGAIEITEKLAGDTARYIAKLTNAGRLWEDCAASLAISMATLEDLIDFISLEDFRKVKGTIPLALLHEQMGTIDKTITPQQIMGKTTVIQQTKGYIGCQLEIVEQCLGTSGDNSLLSLLQKKLKNFMHSFPESYIE